MERDLEARNREIVLALYKATGKGDWVKAATLMTEDILITEAPTLPFAGVYRGVAAMRELFAQVRATGVVGIDMRQVTAGGDWVVVLLDLLYAGSPPERAPLAEAFRLTDGKVCEIVPYYFNTNLPARAPGVQSASHIDSATRQDK
jgi:ketosteroid isomerase-like protein